MPDYNMRLKPMSNASKRMAGSSGYNSVTTPLTLIDIFCGCAKLNL